jgi:NAD(P)-dependent dehydrogenase (short-subunit alcohol dehydrogenase family)
MGLLEGRTAVVTGAGGGIGRSEALEIGQRVEVVFQRTESGRASLLRFRPMAVSAPTEVA